jgi:hypothetical protein
MMLPFGSAEGEAAYAGRPRANLTPLGLEERFRCVESRISIAFPRAVWADLLE